MSKHVLINLNEHSFIVRINLNEQVVSKRIGQFCQKQKNKYVATCPDEYYLDIS